MDGAGVDVDFGGNPLVDQTASVGQVFVKKQVERAGGDVGGRKVGKIFGQHRREPALTMVVRSIVAAQRFPTELVLLARPDELAGMTVAIRAGIAAGTPIKHR